MIRILAVVALLLGLVSDVFSQGQSIEFTENKGQWEGGFDYKAELGNAVVFLNADGFTVLQHHEEDFRRMTRSMHGGPSSRELAAAESLSPKLPVDGFTFNREDIPPDGILVRSHAYKVRFRGASPRAPSEGKGLVTSNVNYLLGDDPSRWKSGVKVFQEVVYKNIYPNVDIRYYTYDGGLKYDLLLHPGADLSKVSMAFEGGVRPEIRNGELVTKTAVGESRQLKPYSYQISEGLKREVGCRYELKDGVVGFSVKGYEAKQELVIDPQFIFGSFTGSRASNWGYTATPGPDGSLFAGGIVFNAGYPTTLGAYQRNFGGGQIDIAITRFSTDGKLSLYATYLGGNDLDIPHSLISDGSGNLIMLGRSSSPNYPTLSRHGPGGGMDIVITKLDATGGRLMGSIRIGGTDLDGANESSDYNQRCGTLAHFYGDNARSEVVLDAANNVYIATSSSSRDLPIVGGSFTRGGQQDALLVKLTPNLGTVTACVPFGGPGMDAGFGIKLNPLNSEVYIAGATMSNTLPGPKPTLANPAHVIKASGQGGIDGFIAVFNNSGSSLLRSVFLGTSDIDIVYGIQFDDKGFPYVMGISRGNWTVVNASYSNSGARQFISKLKPDLTAFEYSTVFGKSDRLPSISPVAFLVDKCENVYVSGWGGALTPCDSPNCFDLNLSSTAGLPVTSNALYDRTDGNDFYIFVLQRNAAAQLYGTYIGQLGGLGDHVDGGTSRFDSRGTIYHAVCGNCYGNQACPAPPFAISRPLPVSPGVVSPRNATLGTSNAGCNLYAFKIELDLSGVQAGLRPSIDGVPNDTLGCVGVRVDFEDTTANAQTYEWNFGDGSPPVVTTNPNVSHTYTGPGTFTVTLTATDPSKCIPKDVSTRVVVIKDDPAILSYNAVKLPPCAALNYEFVNLSQGGSVPFGPNSFLWDFGDGSTPVVAGLANVTHTFPAPGTYNVKLKLQDSRYCNENAVEQVTLKIFPNVKADFELEDKVCVPYLAKLVNTSAGGTKFTWTLSDGSTFVGTTPPDQNYTVPGIYSITLVAEDPNTCNVTDRITKQIEVGTPPVAAFTFSPPNPGIENTPTSFTNLSTNATIYKWNFGDGDTSQQASPIHQYVSAGTFTACLVAINNFGCSDILCQDVESKIRPLLDVPKAFTPNMDGKNDVLYVRGFGITKLDFRIYNRWGQMVFRSTNPKNGWDGTFKGRPQPMDVYAYTLEAVSSTGDEITRKGDITLLR